MGGGGCQGKTVAEIHRSRYAKRVATGHPFCYVRFSFYFFSTYLAFESLEKSLYRFSLNPFHTHISPILLCVHHIVSNLVLLLISREVSSLYLQINLLNLVLLLTSKEVSWF